MNDWDGISTHTTGAPSTLTTKELLATMATIRAEVAKHPTCVVCTEEIYQQLQAHTRETSMAPGAILGTLDRIMGLPVHAAENAYAARILARDLHNAGERVLLCLGNKDQPFLDELPLPAPPPGVFSPTDPLMGKDFEQSRRDAAEYRKQMEDFLQWMAIERIKKAVEDTK